MKATNSFYLSLFIATVFCFFSFTSYSQVSAVDFKLVYNKKTGDYDVYLKVLEGNTKNTRHRIQFNSQIAIVVPTGAEMDITNHYMPIQDNQEYKGTLPMEWEMMKPLVAPSVMPANDFYAFRPTLIPTSLYNDMKAGDEIKLFSFRCSSTKMKEVRLFRNGEDPTSSKGMNGRDFFNSFCIGSVADIYKMSSL